MSCRANTAVAAQQLSASGAIPLRIPPLCSRIGWRTLNFQVPQFLEKVRDNPVQARGPILCCRRTSYL
jgi:hypothetical protein